MGKYILDTHAFLWTVYKDRNFKLGDLAKAAIEDLESELFISSASIYEISNKYKKGKLPEYSIVAENCIAAINELGAIELPLDCEQADFAGKMEWEHKDPFDRMLAAQAQIKGLTLITCDEVFENAPGVATLW